jgi:hypothetical protein
MRTDGGRYKNLPKFSPHTNFTTLHFLALTVAAEKVATHKNCEKPFHSGIYRVVIVPIAKN